MEIEKLLDKRIKELRIRARLTQEQLAEKIGINGKHLSRIELGKNMPNSKLLYLIAKTLNIEPGDLLNFEHHQDEVKIRAEIYEKINNFNEKQLKYLYQFLKIFPN